MNEDELVPPGALVIPPLETAAGQKALKRAARAVSLLRAAEFDGCFAPSDYDDADTCADGTCYCARTCREEAEAALRAAGER